MTIDGIPNRPYWVRWPSSGACVDVFVATLQEIISECGEEVAEDVLRIVARFQRDIVETYWEDHG